MFGAAVFGEIATFAGRLTRGNITIAGSPGDFTPAVTSLKLDPSTVRQGGTFTAYNFNGDVRFMKGTNVGTDGKAREGTFAFI